MFMYYWCGRHGKYCCNVSFVLNYTLRKSCEPRSQVDLTTRECRRYAWQSGIRCDARTDGVGKQLHTYVRGCWWATLLYQVRQRALSIRECMSKSAIQVWVYVKECYPDMSVCQSMLSRYECIWYHPCTSVSNTDMQIGVHLASFLNWYVQEWHPEHRSFHTRWKRGTTAPTKIYVWGHCLHKLVKKFFPSHQKCTSFAYGHIQRSLIFLMQNHRLSESILSRNKCNKQ